MTVLGGLQWRGRHDAELKALGVSIPMTVLGGLQWRGRHDAELKALGVSIPMTVLGGLQLASLSSYATAGSRFQYR